MINQHCYSDTAVGIVYRIVFKYLYSAPQHPWANRGAYDTLRTISRSKLGRKVCQPLAFRANERARPGIHFFLFNS